MSHLISLWPLLFVLAFSLILPIIIVIKWHSRPVLAILAASGVYLLPVILLVIWSVVGGFQRATGSDLFWVFMAFMLIWLLLGLIVLVPTQLKSRGNYKRRTQAKIEEVF